VAVWTTAELNEFLQFVADDPLYPLWWLVALRGLRRREVAGLRWQDLGLDEGELMIVSQRTTIGYDVIECLPKSSASRRTIALDRRTVEILRAHRSRQSRQYARTGQAWRETGHVFIRPDGQPYHPNYFTHRLQYLIKRGGLPPVRLHDLRHGAASLAHAAGADLKTIQDQLGHASVVVTADAYTTVPRTAQRKAAEATARLILTTARGARDKNRRKNRRRARARPPQKSTTAAPASTPASHKRAGQEVEGPNGPAHRASDGEQGLSNRHPQWTTINQETARQRVGRRGLEPRTYGLKVHSSAIELAARGCQGTCAHTPTGTAYPVLARFCRPAA
jgi:integrase-like protein